MMKKANTNKTLFFGFLLFAFGFVNAKQDIVINASQQLPVPFKVTFGPFLQVPSDTSINVIWMVNNLCIPYIWYGIDAINEKSTFNSRHGLVNVCENLSKVTVSDLKPGTTYQYQAISRELVVSGNGKDDVAFYWDLRTHKSGRYSFQTFSQQKSRYSFAVLNDLAGNIDLMDSLLSFIHVDSIDFVVFNGNMLCSVENENQLGKDFIEPCVRLFATRIPFIFVRGTNECRGAMAHYFSDYVGSNQGKHYFSFKHGPVNFIILDSGVYKEDSHQGYHGLVNFQNYRNEQTLWLEQEIQSDGFRMAEFNLVFSHLPFYGGEGGFGEQDIRSKWGGLINSADISLMLSGHSAQYLRINTESEKNNYPILIGGGSSRNTATIIKVDVIEDRIKITVIRSDGTVLDEFFLKGKSGVPAKTGENPSRFALMQNYPNPFNLLTYIKYTLPKDDWITLKVYNILGKEIIKLIDCTQNAGAYTIRFDAGDLPTGIYIYKLQTSKYADVKKLIILK